MTTYALPGVIRTYDDNCSTISTDRRRKTIWSLFWLDLLYEHAPIRESFYVYLRILRAILPCSDAETGQDRKSREQWMSSVLNLTSEWSCRISVRPRALLLSSLSWQMPLSFLESQRTAPETPARN